jgi:flagellar hook-basal body complex protein FliE
MVEPKTDRPSFLETMRSAVDSVNAQQSLSRQLQNAYVRGEDVSLTDVAIAMQKSSVAFEATVQVRNKILESYKEIMSMTV